MSDNTRKITFEAISNARDLGGMQTMDGKTIRSGRLIRSANLWKATDADAKKLTDVYDLRLVIDLRTPMASRQKPDRQIQGVTHELIPVFDDAMIGVTHESDRDYARRNKPMPDMSMLYRMMVTEPFCLQRFGTVVAKIMANESGSVLWHCSEGKDRCGLVAFFLLSALRVDPKQIIEDYLITNEVAVPRAEYFYNEVMKNVGDEAIAASVRDAFIVKPSYIQCAMDTITEQYGDTDRFLSQGLGIPQDLAQRFRENMLED